MDSSGDRGHAASPLRGILKKPVKEQQSPDSSVVVGQSSADRLKSMVEQFAPNVDLASPQRSRGSPLGRGPSAFALPTPRKTLENTQFVNKDDLDEVEMGHRGLEKVSGQSKCQACWKPLGEREGSVLRNCQQHIVCNDCLRYAVTESNESEQIPLCPVDTCCAVMKTAEIEAILSEDPAEAAKGALAIDQENGKQPTCSTLDESEDLPLPEEILVPQSQTMISAVHSRCDKCKEPVGTVGYLDIRNCKLKHKICFECIRNAVRMSKNLVRCPLYRECKSMMARDEVLQARYDIKTANDPRDKASPKKNATPKYIYPNGLPNSDLWPVLMDTKCSKCACDVNVLNGIVIKQCNMHCVCVKCVRISIATNKKVVKCPMYISCKARMLEDEVEAFKIRFGDSLRNY